jgi:hypothetical protein
MKQLNFGFPIPDGYVVVFRASITLKNGKVLYAKQFGIRGFPILVPADKAPS